MSERNYEFRRRLAQVHRPNRRDPALRSAADETAVGDGWRIVFAVAASAVVVTAAKDLQDYCFTSIGVSVLLGRSDDVAGEAAHGERTIVLATAAELPRQAGDLTVPGSYHLDVAPERVVICGCDDRGAAQGSYYLEDLMNLREAPFLARQSITRAPAFSPRMVHSGWGLDAFPDEYLSQMAHHGFDAALLFTGHPNDAVNVVDRTPKGYQDFNELIDRAARYGIDVYAYSYLKSNKHPADPDAEEYYEGNYGQLFRHCPRFKGVVLVGESVEFPSKDPNTTGRLRLDAPPDGVPPSKPSPGWWPCSDYPQWLDLLKKVIRRHSPEADIVFWTYNWGWAPEEPRLALIRSLPTDVSLLVTFEMFEQRRHENVTNVCVDYTLAFEGPGQYFATEARVAAERGLRLYTMCNTGGLTWDMGVIPYQPAPFQWARRHAALLAARRDWGLSGLMESHHYGWWPSFVSELAKQAYWSPSRPVVEAAADIARRDFGEAAAPLVVRAWQAWSEAARDYIPTNEDQYGPFRVGPSYPLLFQRTANLPQAWHAMYGNAIIMPDYHPLEGARQSQGAARFPVEIRSLESMSGRLESGLALLEQALALAPAGKRPALEEMENLGRFMLHSVRTTVHLKQWWLLKEQVLLEADPAKANALLDRMVALAEAEIANAEATIPLVERDSRLGWEPSMEYMTDRAHLEWKIAIVRRVVDHEIAQYRQSLSLTD
ncbi:MAG: hypothetical protein ACYC5O_15785 [Anaerolineae bacterium]